MIIAVYNTTNSFPARVYCLCTSIAAIIETPVNDSEIKPISVFPKNRLRTPNTPENKKVAQSRTSVIS